MPDQLWGIERSPVSPARGEIVCPTIHLWDRPGGLSHGAMRAGTAKHAEPVDVLEARVVDGRTWHRVRTTRERFGWVLDSLLLVEGEKNAA